MTTTKTTVAEWVSLTAFAVGPSAPNGCVSGRVERTLTYYTLFSADYYGSGAKLYLSSHSRLQTADGRIGTAYSFGEDGNLDRITATLVRFGITT